MFALNKYMNKLYKVKWEFDPSKKSELEELLVVEFEQDGDSKYFKIKTVEYTYFDILIGLENLDWVFTKEKDNYVLRLDGQMVQH